MSEIGTCGCDAEAVYNERGFECAVGHTLIGPTPCIVIGGKSYRYIKCDEGFEIRYLYQNVDPKKPWDRISVYGGLSETWGD